MNNQKSDKKILLFLLLSRPALVIGFIFQGFLAIGIARYLGDFLHPQPILLGFSFILFSGLAGIYFTAYFETIKVSEGEKLQRWLSALVSGQIWPEKVNNRFFNQVPLLSGLVMLTGAAICGFMLIQSGWVTITAITLMGLIGVGVILYGVPPMRLADSGFGEILLAVIWGAFVPMFMYSLIAGQIHRLIVLSTIPLVFLILAVILLYQFIHFGRDEKYEAKTLLVRMGWTNGFFYYTALNVIAFFSLGIASLLNFPVRILLPSFFVLPVAVLQMWYMNRIANGVRPNWNALLVGSIAIYVAVAYLLSFSFWLR